MPEDPKLSDVVAEGDRFAGVLGFDGSEASLERIEAVLKEMLRGREDGIALALIRKWSAAAGRAEMPILEQVQGFTRALSGYIANVACRNLGARLSRGAVQVFLEFDRPEIRIHLDAMFGDLPRKYRELKSKIRGIPLGEAVLSPEPPA